MPPPNIKDHNLYYRMQDEILHSANKLNLDHCLDGGNKQPGKSNWWHPLV